MGQKLSDLMPNVALDTNELSNIKGGIENPRFIIGDIYEKSIEDIWTGERALELANWQQTKIQKNSPCSSCELFQQCLTYPNKCFANTIKAYGDENWDYPDPRCSRALPFINSL